MEERREISRIEYNAKGVIVIIESAQKIECKVANISPLGMGVLIPASINDIVGKDIIIIADCIVMYANVNREQEYDDAFKLIGISGKSFDSATLNYLFEHIG